MYEQLGWIMNNEIQKDQNATVASEVLRAKVGYSAWSLHTVWQKGWPDHLSHPSCPAHQSTLPSHPIYGTRSPHRLERARVPVCPSCCSIAARVSVKPCLISLSGILSISTDEGVQGPWWVTMEVLLVWIPHAENHRYS